MKALYKEGLSPVPSACFVAIQVFMIRPNTNTGRIDIILGEKASGESTFGRIDLIPHQLGVFTLSTSLSITLFEYVTCEYRRGQTPGEIVYASLLYHLA